MSVYWEGEGPYCKHGTPWALCSPCEIERLKALAVQKLSPFDGEPLDALQILTRDRDEWERRALEAESRAEKAEATVRMIKCECSGGQWCHICDPCSLHRAKIRELEAQVEGLEAERDHYLARANVAEERTIARVVAWLLSSAEGLNVAARDPMRIVAYAIDRGEWRKWGSRNAHHAKALERK